MHVLWLELGTLTVAVLSGGFFYRERLATKPLLELVVGAVFIIGALQFLFGAVSSAYTWTQSVADDMQAQARLINEAAEQAEDLATNKEFQSNLTRLGCYHGNIDGIWGQQSRIALADFLDALGKADQFGDTVKVTDARKLFAEAADGVCAAARRAAVLRTYRTAHNAYLRRCVKHFLVFPIELATADCTELKRERDNSAQSLAEFGIPLPG